MRVEGPPGIDETRSRPSVSSCSGVIGAGVDTRDGVVREASAGEVGAEADFTAQVRAGGLEATTEEKERAPGARGDEGAG